MNWYLKVLRQYADFNGRARRKEYWMFVLFNLIFALLAIMVDNALGLAWGGIGYGPIYALYTLFIIVPALSVSVRRLHDTGKSGFLILLGLIPIIGGIILLVFFCMDSQEGSNEFGPNPKGEIA